MGVWSNWQGKGSFLHRAGSFNFAQDERRRERQRRRQVLGSKNPAGPGVVCGDPSGFGFSRGIGRVTLVRLETGEQPPRFEALSAIARALGRA